MGGFKVSVGAAAAMVDQLRNYFKTASVMCDVSASTLNGNYETEVFMFVGFLLGLPLSLLTGTHGIWASFIVRPR